MGARRGERGLEAKSDPQTGHNDDNRIRHLPPLEGPSQPCRRPSRFQITA